MYSVFVRDPKDWRPDQVVLDGLVQREKSVWDRRMKETSGHSYDGHGWYHLSLATGGS